MTQAYSKESHQTTGKKQKEMNRKLQKQSNKMTISTYHQQLKANLYAAYKSLISQLKTYTEKGRGWKKEFVQMEMTRKQGQQYSYCEIQILKPSVQQKTKKVIT